MTNLLSVSFALLMGLLMTRAFKYLHLDFPDVTAYLIAGVLIGPYCIGALGINGIGFQTYEGLETLKVISSAALGFIAFSIGNEFRLSQLKNTGRQAVITGFFEALTAVLFVDIILFGLHFILGDEVLNIPTVITLGAIASATAPAATLMVVRQYKARGKVTELLLPIVALDDAIALVCFAVSFGIAQAMVNGNLDLISIIIEPVIEIVASLILGALMGFLLTELEKLYFSNSNRLNLTIAFVVATVALSSYSFKVGSITVSFSSLLVCMMLGTVFCNMCPRSEDIMGRADRWTSPLFALFFILSGAELNLGVFKNPAVVLIGITYIIARSLGKYTGASVGSTLTKCDPTVRKYLGITLLPQAGVALGMSAQAVVLSEYSGTLIRNIILFGVLIYELFGPMMTRWALQKSGDIRPVEKEKTTHARFTKAR